MIMSAFQASATQDFKDLSQNSLDEKHRTHDNTKPLSSDHTTTQPQDTEVSPFMDPILSQSLLHGSTPKTLREYPDFRNAKWVIFPDDPAKGWWDCLIFLFLLFCAGVEPYRLAMTDTEEKDGLWMCIDWTVMAVFALDLVLNFYTSYYDETASLVITKKKIAYHYIRTWFLVDFLSCFPFDQFVGLGNFSANYGKLARLPRLYRLLKSGKLAKLMLDHNSQVLELLQKLISHAPVFLHFMSFFATVIWCCHVIACLYIFLARMEDFSPQTWVGAVNLDPDDEARLYISGLYYILVTLTTIGYGDISPKSNQEKTFVMVVMVFGIFVYSYTMGSLINVWKNQHTSKVQFLKKMRVLEDIDRQVNISAIMFNKLRKAIRYDADKSIVHKRKLFEELPTHLRTELVMLMNEKLIRNIPFFHNRPIGFLAEVIPNLSPLFIMKADYIYHFSDPNDSLFFLTKGEVALIGQSIIQLKTTLVLITPGNYFGELDLIFEEKHTQQARAESDSELLVMERSAFFDLCIDFPFFKDEILSCAKTRLTVLKETKDIANRVLESMSRMESKFTFQPSMNYERSTTPIPDIQVQPFDSRPSHDFSEDSFVPNLRRRSYVSKHMNSRSKLALRTDARVVNDKQSFEMLAVIGEVEKRVENLDERLDSWGSRWNEMEGSLCLIGPRKNREKMKTAAPVYSTKPYGGQ